MSQKIFFICGTKQDLIAVAYNRFIKMDPSTGEALKTWRFNTMKVRLPVKDVFLSSLIVIYKLGKEGFLFLLKKFISKKSSVTAQKRVWIWQHVKTKFCYFLH